MSVSTLATSKKIIDQVSISSYGRARHYEAPCLKEGADYLEHLLKRGNDKTYIRTTAGYLLQIIKIMKLEEVRVVSESEIKAASIVWGKLRNLDVLQRPTAAGTFVGFAMRWLSFIGKLQLPPQEEGAWMIDAFVGALSVRGLKRVSVMRHAVHIKRVFRYFPREFDLQKVSLVDLDEYIKAQRAEGWKPQSIVSACNSLRAFFRFAELQGWCQPAISLGIKNPRTPVCTQEAKAPTWNEVLVLIRSFKAATANDRQGKAMVMLCAIYGLRSSEVARLQLDDFDWRNETFVVRRSKGGGIQRYPLHYQVGQAILAYLKIDRPQCPSRSVFLNRRAPHRQITPGAMWRFIGPRLRVIGTRVEYVGPHSLRHACATRLLAKGASLKQIADYLGHRNLKSVDTYARCDPAWLVQVAKFPLRDLL